MAEFRSGPLYSGPFAFAVGPTGMGVTVIGVSSMVMTSTGVTWAGPITDGEMPSVVTTIGVTVLGRAVAFGSGGIPSGGSAPFSPTSGNTSTGARVGVGVAGVTGIAMPTLTVSGLVAVGIGVLANVLGVAEIVIVALTTGVLTTMELATAEVVTVEVATTAVTMVTVAVRVNPSVSVTAMDGPKTIGVMVENSLFSDNKDVVASAKGVGLSTTCAVGVSVLMGCGVGVDEVASMISAGAAARVGGRVGRAVGTRVFVVSATGAGVEAITSGAGAANMGAK
jgi:hypothetical protein